MKTYSRYLIAAFALLWMVGCSQSGNQPIKVASRDAMKEEGYLEKNIEKLEKSNACQTCDFTYVVLSNKKFPKADLQGVNFNGADLRNMDLREAKFNHSFFVITEDCPHEPASLAGSNLMQAQLQSVDLEEVDLTDTNLSKADLANSNVRVALLSNSNLSNANLQGVDFYKSDMQDANLKGANLEGANLKKALLMGADLEGAILKGANLSGARWIDGSICAKGSIGKCIN